MPVGAIVAAAATVASTISGVVDADKRRKYEQNLAFLSIQEKEALNKTLLQQKSEEARQKVLSEVLGTMNRSRIDAMVQIQKEKEKTQRYTLLLVLSGLIVLTGVLIYVSKKKK